MSSGSIAENKSIKSIIIKKISILEKIVNKIKIILERINIRVEIMIENMIEEGIVIQI